MRTRIAFCGLALLLVLVAGLGTAEASSSDPFGGAWKGTDVDGSAMTLAISGGGVTRQVVQHDLSCGGCDPSGYPGTGVGSGTLDEGVLHAVLTWHLAPGLGTISNPVEFTAHPDGTLVQTITDCPECPSQIWFRAGS